MMAECLCVWALVKYERMLMVGLLAVFVRAYSVMCVAASLKL